MPTKSEFSDRFWRADKSDGLRPLKSIRKDFLIFMYLIFLLNDEGLGHCSRMISYALKLNEKNNK